MASPQRGRQRGLQMTPFFVLKFLFLRLTFFSPLYTAYFQSHFLVWALFSSDRALVRALAPFLLFVFGFQKKGERLFYHLSFFYFFPFISFYFFQMREPIFLK
ncbi:hypothetical protein BDZ91DRAFT_452888 [Kalaharituber pfeilii]|nr:hypothetical protein BDZ91DRAFT_452888 [Kalaharituber pfeilii]